MERSSPRSARSSRRRCRARGSRRERRVGLTPRSVSSASSSPVSETRREAVAPLDLAEERLAVLRVAHGARRDRERALGAERLGFAAVVGEHVPHARDRDGEQAASRVDAFAEAGDRGRRASSRGAVLDVGDEQPGRVRAEVDRGDSITCADRTRDGVPGDLAAAERPRRTSSRARRPAGARATLDELARCRRRSTACSSVCVERARRRGRAPWPAGGEPLSIRKSWRIRTTRNAIAANGDKAAINVHARRPSHEERSTAVLQSQPRRGVEQSGSSPGS